MILIMVVIIIIASKAIGWDDDVPRFAFETQHPDVMHVLEQATLQCWIVFTINLFQRSTCILTEHKPFCRYPRTAVMRTLA